MTIKTPPASQEYKDNWDVIFGKKKTLIREVSFISQWDMENKTPANKEASVISITTPGNPPAKFKNEDFTHVLRIEFDDIYEDVFEDKHLILDTSKEWHGLGLPSILDAYKIVNFLKSIDTNTLIIHCHAGMSRSAAVAQFAAKEFDYSLVIGKYDTSGANPRLLRLLNKVFEQGFRPYDGL